MDDDLQNLEAELLQLRPRRPSSALEQRIGGELARAARTIAGASWPWLALPAAAVVAVMLALWWHQVGPATPLDKATVEAATTLAAAEPAFKAVAVENVLYAARDEGLVTLEDGTPAVRQRLNYVDTITWRNPRTNASVRWSVPREEVRVVPVSFQ